MLPMESAAIIRGLLRVHNATDALEMLNDELSLPLEVSVVDSVFAASQTKDLTGSDSGYALGFTGESRAPQIPGAFLSVHCLETLF